VALSRLVVYPLSVALIVSLAGRAVAAHPSELLLPATTKGFISTQDVDEVRNEFNKTQFGQMSHDPVMQPFIDDLKKQIGAKLERAGKKLGVKWPDMEGVYGGEAAIAIIQPDPKDKMSHATALIVDITGKKKEADDLLKKVAANQRANRAVSTAFKEAGLDVIVYTQPLKPGETAQEKAFQCVAGDQLIFSDHEATMRGIIRRLDGKATDALASVVAFNESLKHCSAAANGVRHQVRWFIEPFGFAEANRAAQGGKRKRGTDLLKILQGQGFTAIQGVGGHIFFASHGSSAVVGEQPEILHRTFVYAPPVNRPAGANNQDKYNLAMRMLDFPNGAASSLEAQPWALPDVATYLSLNWKMREAFEYSSTLVDAYIGDKGAFEEIWTSLKSDVNGPQIDIRKELLDHFGTRTTLLSDVKLPVNTKSERLMALVELKNGSAAAVAKTLQKAFEKDPQARKKTHKGHLIWEITQQDSLAEDDTELMIEGAGFVSTQIPGPAPVGSGVADSGSSIGAATELVAAEPDPQKKGDSSKSKTKARPKDNEEEARLPNMAMTVFLDHLIIATHLDYIEDFIDHQEKQAAGQATGLAQEKDYQRVRPVLVAQGSNLDSFHFFTRTDESYRATYELFKQGKLPEAETLLARLLNSIMGPQEEGAIRQQELDGSKLPNFDLVKKYLGPGGLFTQSENDGWWLVGCLLKKQ
jgi:hypothetical protein